MKKIKLILFDLDGVLIDSKKNMEIAWYGVKKKFNIRKSFKEYSKHIGLPFDKILKKINIHSNHKKIQAEYKKISEQNFNKIKIYTGVKATIFFLLKNKISIGIVTSKDRDRTIKVLKKFNINLFNIIVCPKKNLRGKPNPDQINYAIKRMKSKCENTVYLGDMYVDYLAAKYSRIDFIFANYGYGKKKFSYKTTINKISDLKKIV